MTDSPYSGGLGRQIVENMPSITLDRIGRYGIDNAERNQSKIAGSGGQSIAALTERTLGDGRSAVVIAAGPSVKRTDPLAAIKTRNYKGAIIATDSAMLYCLRNGVVPDLVVTLDPHGDRIVRWFGDKSLTEEKISEDDYFRRQDMDEAFSQELKVNVEILDLLNTHGSKIKIAAATSSSTAVVDRILETGMDAYWWNPFYDDPDKAGEASLTRGLWRLNRLPIVNAGGNVGTACWMFAHAVLGIPNVALCGMDFSYYPDTSYERTQYYREIVDLVGEERLDDVFIRIHNPDLDREFFTDPAYMWYRECLLSLVEEASCTTYNCTGGGIVFGGGIVTESVESFLDRPFCK